MNHVHPWLDNFFAGYDCIRFYSILQAPGIDTVETAVATSMVGPQVIPGIASLDKPG